jgi:hypothetical protein
MFTERDIPAPQAKVVMTKESSARPVAEASNYVGNAMADLAVTVDRLVQKLEEGGVLGSPRPEKDGSNPTPVSDVPLAAWLSNVAQNMGNESRRINDLIQRLGV